MTDNNDYELHYTVVFNVATGEFRVEDCLGFDPYTPLWNGAFWERVTEEFDSFDKDAIHKLRIKIGELPNE